MTKTLFIPAKLKPRIIEGNILKISSKLPKNIAIAYSIQYGQIAKQIKEILKKKHKITKFLQVFGCSKPHLPKTTKAILLISSGKFHAISLAYETKLPVYILYNNKIEKINKEDLEIIEKKNKTSYMKFLNADKIGILVSTKPGQQNLKKALELRKKLNKQNKKTYLFMANNINPQEFENFNDIQSYINTACSRMDLESSSIINMDKIK